MTIQKHNMCIGCRTPHCWTAFILKRAGQNPKSISHRAVYNLLSKTSLVSSSKLQQRKKMVLSKLVLHWCVFKGRKLPIRRIRQNTTWRLRARTLPVLFRKKINIPKGQCYHGGPSHLRDDYPHMTCRQMW